MTVIDLAEARALRERLENLLLQVERDLMAQRYDVAVTNFTHALFLAHQVPDSERLRGVRRELCRRFGGFSDPNGGETAA